MVDETNQIVNLITCHKHMHYFILTYDHEYDHNEDKNMCNYLLSINYINIRDYLLNINFVTILFQYIGFSHL